MNPQFRKKNPSTPSLGHFVMFLSVALCLLGPSNDCCGVTEDQLKSAVARWILKCREGHRIPHSVMESVVLGAQSLFELGIACVTHSIAKIMKDNEVSEEVVSSVTAALTKFDVFRGLSTTHLQNEYIKEKFHYIVSDITSSVAPYHCPSNRSQ